MTTVPIGPQVLLREVLPLYSIGSKPVCRLHHRGLNQTYLVTSGRDRYVLRVYTPGWRTRNEIEFELDVLEFLRDRGLPVCAPLLTTRARRIVTVQAKDGRRYAALFPYAWGRPAEHTLSREQARKLGFTVVAIHCALDEFRTRFRRPELNLQFLLDRPLRLVRSFYPDRRPETSYLEKQTEKLKEAIQNLKLPKKAPAFGVCIGDVHGGNAHFSKSGDPALFDFDQCGYGWRAFEIAKFIHASRIRRVSKASISEFQAGYQAVRCFDKAELAAIPHFMSIAAIWQMGIHASAVGSVLPRSWMNDRWLSERLRQLRDYEKERS